MRRGLILWFLLIYCCAFGQEYYSNLREISVEEGLSHYKVLSLLPDKEGMWIGTENGLNYYDGYHWKYWTQDAGQLTNEAVNFIYKDQENRLWLFDTKTNMRPRIVVSIDVLSAQRDSILSFEALFGAEAPFTVDDIRHFFVDHQAFFYFYTDQQCWQYAPQMGFKAIPFPDGFVPSLRFANGSFAGFRDHRLLIINEDLEIIYESEELLESIDYIIKGTAQKFWLAPDHGTCMTFEQKPQGGYRIKPFLVEGQTSPLNLLHYDEEKEQLWLTQRKEIYLFNNREQLIYKREGVYPRVVSLDKDGNLWTGRRELKIFRLKQTPFKRYLYQTDQDNPTVDTYQCRGMIEKDGRLLVSTYKGIQVINLKTGVISPHSLGEMVNFTFLEGRNRNIWAAHRGLLQLDSSGYYLLKIYERTDNNLRVWSLFQDLNDRIWLGNIGLSYLDNEKIVPYEKYNEFTKLKNAIILFFYQDKNGVIWLGSNMGLYQLDLEKGIIAAYGKDQTDGFYLPTNKFQHMYQDAQGIYWIATEDVGLLRWNKATGVIQVFDQKNGFLSDNIYTICEDDFGSLWLSSFNGLIQFHKESQQVRVFTEEEGIGENEFNRISYWESDNGQLFFGGQNGLIGFHPKDFQDVEDSYPFDLRIKKTTVIGQKVREDTSESQSSINLQNLSSTTKAIRLELACSDLFWTDKMDIHYSLQGMDRSKNITMVSQDYVISNNQIEIFGLTPSHYNLQIKGIHKNGKVLTKTINIPIVIARPLLHLPSFWLGLIALLAAAAWGLFKFRTIQLRKRQAQLQQMVEERTQEILSNQKTIRTQAEQIEAMKDQLERKDELWLEQFRSIINSRLTDPNLYLPDIIDEMEISRSVFYQKVKSLTQMTPNQYIQELRLNKAKAILDEGQVKTVKEVAYAIGMKRPAYFSKLFKDRFGILPSAYFRNHSN